MKNIKIDIDDEFISVTHHGEEVVGWEAQEWGEDGTIVPSIVNAIHLANTDIFELRRLVGKPLIVGTTDVTTIENGQVKYFINTMDDSGREQTTDFIDDYDEAMNRWEQMKEDESNYDMHFYRSLVVLNNAETEMELIDDEVIDSYQDEDNELYQANS